MGRPAPAAVPDGRAEQRRLIAQRAKRRARLLADERPSGWYARADDLLPTPQAP
jgi:hypothetical protein